MALWAGPRMPPGGHRVSRSTEPHRRRSRPGRRRTEQSARVRTASASGSRAAVFSDLALRAAGQRTNWDLLDLDRAARALAGDDKSAALAAARLIERILSKEEEGPLAEPARLVLRRAADAASPELRRRAFQLLVPVEREIRFGETLRGFLTRRSSVLGPSTRTALSDRGLSEAKLEAFVAVAVILREDQSRVSENTVGLGRAEGCVLVARHP